MLTTLRALTAAALLTLTVATGCSSGAPASTAPSAAPSTGAALQVNVVLTNAGCVPDRASVPAGPVAFSVVNNGGVAVSELELMQGERNLGERENLTPGLSGTFMVQLQPGSYELYCPGAAAPRTPFEVTAAS